MSSCLTIPLTENASKNQLFECVKSIFVDLNVFVFMQKSNFRMRQNNIFRFKLFFVFYALDKAELYYLHDKQANIG